MTERFTGFNDFSVLDRFPTSIYDALKTHKNACDLLHSKLVKLDTARQLKV